MTDPKILVVRSVYGGYDPPKTFAQQTMPYEQIVVTDTNYPRNHMHPRLAAKHAKCLPWDYETTQSDMIVWLDGSFHVTSPEWLAWLWEVTEGQQISQYKHPWRDDILDEAHASIGMEKYNGQPVIAQAEHYLDRGHPRHWGLWSTGMAAYRRDTGDTAVLNLFGHRWLAEQVKWSYQDQISQPYLLRSYGLRPFELPDDMYNSRFIRMENHARND